MDEEKAEGKCPEQTNVCLRTAPGFMAARPVRTKAYLNLHRNCGKSGSVHTGYGFHTCRAHADHGIPILSIMGLSDYRILCRKFQTRHTAGTHVPGRRTP